MKIQLKTIAIVLFIIVLLETLLLVAIFALGASEIRKENECINLYYGIPEAMSYAYDSTVSVCYLYDRDNNVVLQRIIQ